MQHRWNSSRLHAMGKGVENMKYQYPGILRQTVSDAALRCGECPGKAGNKALEMVDINEKLDQEPLADYLFKHYGIQDRLLPARYG
ncbi:MAG: hypothetical protein ACLRRB_01730 [Ruminococcus sp.]